MSMLGVRSDKGRLLTLLLGGLLQLLLLLGGGGGGCPIPHGKDMRFLVFCAFSFYYFSFLAFLLRGIRLSLLLYGYTVVKYSLERLGVVQHLVDSQGSHRER